MQVDQIIGEPFTELSETHSTNTYVKALIRKGKAITHGAAWMAHTQTQGRGQRDKMWVSEPNMNLALSIALQPQTVPVTRQFELSVAVALAVHSVLKKEYSDCYIKWPNDIYCGNKKVCGILIENIIQGSTWQWSVVGIGINLNQIHFDADLPNPVSLKLLTGKDYDVVSFAKEICTGLQKRYLMWQEENFATLLQEYNDVLYKRGENVQMKKGINTFECVIQGVDAKGFLHVNGIAKLCFTFGEVELIR